MPLPDKGLTEFLNLFQDEPISTLSVGAGGAASHRQGSHPDELNQLIWQDLLASEKLFPEILAPLIAAVQNHHPVVVVQSHGTAQERQVTLRINEIIFNRNGWSIQGLRDNRRADTTRH
jgi:hypothetical protein